MSGIKTRLVGSYLFIIIVTVAILEVFLIFSVTQFAYKSLENSLENQIKISVDFYNSYLSSAHLKKNVQDNADIFWKNTNAEVQIIDNNKEMIMDSIGVLQKDKVEQQDVEKALKGDMSSLIYYDKVANEKLLAVSHPLTYQGKTEGVLRYVTPLKRIDKTISKIKMVFLIIGLGVIAMSGIASLFISDTVVKPIKEVTDTAKNFALGRFNVRLNKKRDDELGQLSDTLNSMADEVLKNDRLKNDFIASISHELRTPLTSIKGWAATIKSSDLNDKEEIFEGLDIIEKESDRLSALVEELLDFSKFVSGKVKLNKDYVDIINITRYVDKQMRHRAHKKNIDFRLSLEENIPPILADENRIKQVLINLLDNAFNFTEKEGIVELKVYTDKEYIVILVKDNGIGIPKEDLPHVTEKFFKGKSSNSKNGIGLSICNEIITLHNGSLKIFSELGLGTEVYVYMPKNNN